MFIKITKAKNYEYIKLVESYREGAKTKHRVLYNFGRRDLIKNDQMFINMVKKLCEIAEISLPNSKDSFLDCSEATLLHYGHIAYRKLWEDLGIANALQCIQDQSNMRFSFLDAVFLMAIQHLLDPRSKKSTHDHQDTYFGLNKVDLHHLYRALDQLAEHKEYIEQTLFEQNYTFSKQQVDVVFYDVTTFAFESVIVDELRNFGFSKDQKFKEVQVVMGLMIDAKGLPIGYELFTGNTFDGKTLVKSLENIHKRFGINRVILVADRGINSKGNLNLIKEAGYGYIVASRIRSLKKYIQNQILDPDGYTTINEDFRYKTIDYENCFTNEAGKKYALKESLVVSYSQKRAAKDIRDRQRLIEKAKKLLEKPAAIKAASKRGGKKYLLETAPSVSNWELDLKKIEEDARFDGYYGIQTSEQEMPPQDVIEAYHTLWKIEESFRVMKSTLEVRPVFHWTPKRIHGHFVVCFLAFMMERHLEMLMLDEQASAEKIRESLNAMQLARINLNKEEIYIKAKGLPLGNKIFQKLQLKHPKNLSYYNELLECFSIKPKDLWGQLSLF